MSHIGFLPCIPCQFQRGPGIGSLRIDEIQLDDLIPGFFELLCRIFIELSFGIVDDGTFTGHTDELDHLQDDREGLTGIRRTDQNRMIVVCIDEDRMLPESRHIDGEAGTLCDRLTIYLPASYGIELVPVIDSEECQEGIIRKLRIVQDTIGFRQKGRFIQYPSDIFFG